MQLEQDTIVAISTPPGRGGIGIVRLSGAQARGIAEPLLRLRRPMAAGRARFAHVVDAAGTDAAATLDEAVVTFFAAPHSYTSEDVVEIATHGAPVILEAILRAAIAAGARLAEPGEFTQRAFLSGRLDLTQAEAVHDLIAAQTLAQARVAAAQLGGALAAAVAPHKQQMIALIAELEAGIDFAEDDLELLGADAISARLAALDEPLAQLAATYGYGRILRDGFTLAIVGRPNAGKSSLFNRLLDRERAIVTAEAGTTRDPISERLSLGGIPVELVDTAGLREVAAGAQFEPERQGIARSRTMLAEADVVLHVIDLGPLAGSAAVSSENGLLDDPEDRVLAEMLRGRPHVTVFNKHDLAPGVQVASQGGSSAMISALTGEGVDDLRAAIVATLTHGAAAADSALVTNLRQHQALTSAVAALERAGAAAGQGLPHEMLLLDLYAALEALDALTGETSADEILGLIFSKFCIGK